jgi:DNA polymerase sigma
MLSQLFSMSLETYLFVKNLEQYQDKTNKIDCNFAKLLLMAAENIQDFINSAEIVESDENSNIFDLVPSLQNGMIQGHRSYFCVPCNSCVKVSTHIYQKSHLEMLKKTEATLIEKSLKQDKRNDKEVVEDKKIAKKNDKDDKKSKTKDYKLTQKIRAFILSQDLLKFTKGLQTKGDTILKSQVHMKICETLKHCLMKRFPKVQIYSFGSIVNGLGREGADLDVFVDLQNKSYYEKPSKRIMSHAIFQTRDILAAHPDIWTGFCPITKARTPILKIFSKQFNMQCDLSFSNGLSHCNTMLIGYFMNLQPICKKIVLFVKCWVSNLDLGMNSYIITQMVIFYLQKEGYLPSVHTLQSKMEPIYIDGWNSVFDRKLQLQNLSIPLLDDSMYTLYLYGFFNYYACEFDFKKYVISILAGYPVEKSVFDHDKIDELPEIFERFKLYMKGLVKFDEVDEVDFLFSHKKPIVIQDPFELCHNVAKGQTEKKLDRLIALMKETAEVIRTNREK